MIGLPYCRPIRSLHAALILLFGLTLAGRVPLAAAAAGSTQSPSPDPEAFELVHALTAERPAQEISFTGLFKITPSSGPRHQVPMKYSLILAQTNWQSRYEADPTASSHQQLVITHQPDGPNQYLLTQIDLRTSQTNSQNLSGEAANIPFANTDFWLSDLGMEFLHWPSQRLIQDAKFKMRFGRPCRVLESSNPHPGKGAYSRVVSWIDADLGNLLMAEAYDASGKRLKVFSLKHFTRINGRWQVKELELQNEQTDSDTVLEFDLQVEVSR